MDAVAFVELGAANKESLNRTVRRFWPPWPSAPKGLTVCRQHRYALFAAQPVSAAVGGPINATLARWVAWPH